MVCHNKQIIVFWSCMRACSGASGLCGNDLEIERNLDVEMKKMERQHRMRLVDLPHYWGVSCFLFFFAKYQVLSGDDLIGAHMLSVGY